jgi:hypothetical protein
LCALFSDDDGDNLREKSILVAQKSNSHLKENKNEGSFGFFTEAKLV